VNLSLPATPQGTCDAAAWATLSISDPTSQTATLQKGQTATFTGTVSLADSDAVDQTCLLGQDAERHRERFLTNPRSGARTSVRTLPALGRVCTCAGSASFSGAR
jgi:hypothetical protein